MLGASGEGWLGMSLGSAPAVVAPCAVGDELGHTPTAELLLLILFFGCRVMCSKVGRSSV